MPQRRLRFLDVVVDLQTDMALLEVSAGRGKKKITVDKTDLSLGAGRKNFAVSFAVAGSFSFTTAH